MTFQRFSSANPARPARPRSGPSIGYTIVRYIKEHGPSTLADLAALPGHPSRSTVLSVPMVKLIPGNPELFRVEDPDDVNTRSHIGNAIGSGRQGGPIGAGGSFGGEIGAGSSFGGSIGRRRS